MTWQHSDDGETWVDLQPGEAALRFVRSVHDVSEIPAPGRVWKGEHVDREAVAQRVAQGIMGKCDSLQCGQGQVPLDEMCRRCQYAAGITVALLAFPVGDAEPVVAGKRSELAAWLRQWCEWADELGIGQGDDTDTPTFLEIASILDAAPGGRPRCAKCGGGIALRAPSQWDDQLCPACASADAGTT